MIFFDNLLQQGVSSKLAGRYTDALARYAQAERLITDSPLTDIELTYNGLLNKFIRSSYQEPLADAFDLYRSMGKTCFIMKQYAKAATCFLYTQYILLMSGHRLDELPQIDPSNLRHLGYSLQAYKLPESVVDYYRRCLDPYYDHFHKNTQCEDELDYDFFDLEAAKAGYLYVATKF